MTLTRKELRDWIDRLGVEHKEMADDFGILKSNLSHILAGRQKLTQFRAKAFECWLRLKEMELKNQNNN